MLYPPPRLIEIHKPENILQVKIPDSLVEEKLLGKKFSLSLKQLFSEDTYV